jgi:hypothetical protein
MLQCTTDGASFPVLSEGNTDMNNGNFWSDYADAMELSVEGNRLIAQEIVELAGGLWNKAIRSLDRALQNVGQHPHLPPI